MTYLKDVFGKDLFGQFIGFEETVDALRRATEHTAKTMGYPPYNIKQVKENKYVIEMAVAGFSNSDIEITLEGSKLIIKGNAKDDGDDTNFLYKGIANRAFERVFTVNDKVEIKDAELVNGMLKVWMENIVKIQDTVKKIGIKGL